MLVHHRRYQLMTLFSAAAAVLVSAHSFNDSRVINDRSPRQRFYSSEPTSSYYENLNPFRPYWMNRPSYAGKPIKVQNCFSFEM